MSWSRYREIKSEHVPHGLSCIHPMLGGYLQKAWQPSFVNLGLLAGGVGEGVHEKASVQTYLPGILSYKLNCLGLFKLNFAWVPIVPLSTLCIVTIMTSSNFFLSFTNAALLVLKTIFFRLFCLVFKVFQVVEWRKKSVLFTFSRNKILLAIFKC